jgi:hypothetical protein
LHFSGEKTWWPKDGEHSITFNKPAGEDKLNFDDLTSFLDNFLR